MKAIIITAIILIVVALTSCSPYDTSAVAAHAGGMAIARSPVTGAMMAAPNTGRQQAEAQKSQAFYGRR